MPTPTTLNLVRIQPIVYAGADPLGPAAEVVCSVTCGNHYLSVRRGRLPEVDSPGAATMSWDGSSGHRTLLDAFDFGRAFMAAAIAGDVLGYLTPEAFAALNARSAADLIRIGTWHLGSIEVVG